MSCGACSKPKATGAGYTKSASGVSVRDDVMTAAAMCASCAHAGIVMCTLDGKALTTHARSLDCPKGRHPVNGFVRWLWVEWIGVPYPIRWWLARKGKVTDISKLPGCGCIRFLKDLWTKTRLT